MSIFLRYLIYLRSVVSCVLVHVASRGTVFFALGPRIHAARLQKDFVLMSLCVFSRVIHPGIREICVPVACTIRQSRPQALCAAVP